MNILEAINYRSSIRAFKADPVPRHVLTSVLETAIRAPSSSNTQPWEFAVIGGQTLELLKKRFSYNVAAGVKSTFDIPSPRFPDTYMERSSENNKRLFAMVGIERSDKVKRTEWLLRMARMHDAPNCIILYMDRALPQLSLLDMGTVIQNITLAALEFGLGTCIQGAAVTYADVLREILDIPDFKLFVIGISIGYPDWDANVNRFKSNRVELSNISRWYGF